MTPRKTQIMGVLLMIVMIFLTASGAEEALIYDDIYLDPINSVRLETAKHPNADSPNAEVVIKGKTIVRYIQPAKNISQELVTFYVADKNGFRAKYSLVQEKYPPNRNRVGLGALKAAAG